MFTIVENMGSDDGLNGDNGGLEPDPNGTGFTIRKNMDRKESLYRTSERSIFLPLHRLLIQATPL